jgi:hypothetical protein
MKQKSKYKVKNSLINIKFLRKLGMNFLQMQIFRAKNSPYVTSYIYIILKITLYISIEGVIKASCKM